jgi:mono/diheme cytochrome c family protein
MIVMKYFLGFSTLIFYTFLVSNYTVIANYFNEKEGIIVPNEFQEKTALEKSIAKGKEVYADFCIQCHMANGKGDDKSFPPLDGSDWLSKKTNESIHAVKYGQTGEVVVKGKKYNNTMPPMGLSNQEIADVLNYVRNSWSNKHHKMITVKHVEAIKQ